MVAAVAGRFEDVVGLYIVRRRRFELRAVDKILVRAAFNLLPILRLELVSTDLLFRLFFFGRRRNHRGQFRKGSRDGNVVDRPRRFEDQQRALVFQKRRDARIFHAAQNQQHCHAH